jgi:hypothetical protein
METEPVTIATMSCPYGAATGELANHPPQVIQPGYRVDHDEGWLSAR